MGSGAFAKCKFSGKSCLECGKEIEIGEEYWYCKTKNKSYVYCKPCKNDPKHIRKVYDHEKIFENLKRTPLFIHEFRENYGVNQSAKSNEIMRRMMFNGYPLRIFKWQLKSKKRDYSQIDEEFKKIYRLNILVIYYVEGTENKVVKRILDQFDFNDINWKELLSTLFSKNIPIVLNNKETILKWANQNVYN